MRLRPGDMQFVYNHSLFHDRTSFVDWSEPEKKRHLLRLWLSLPGDRELPPTFAQAYGNLDVGGDITFDEVNARNATITGIATVGFSTSANAYISGMTTSALLNVGMGATMVKVSGVPATRVGINSVGAAYTLDVDGDINSTGTIRQAGTSVLTTASGDATALAIALG